MGGNREKSNIAILPILEEKTILKVKIISHFDGSNNIFADCTIPEILITQKVLVKSFLFL